MFPGVILQMTYWYRPDEMSIRLLYFCAQNIPFAIIVQPNDREQTSSATFLASSVESLHLHLTQCLAPAVCQDGNGFFSSKVL
jgi:hypothetical protein